MNILLMVSEEKAARQLSRFLANHGFSVEIAANEKNGLALAESGSFDLILLDRKLAGCDGLTTLKKMRAEGVDTFLILLIEENTARARVEGLDSGADDCLLKPFALIELLARIRAMTRRMGKELPTDNLTTPEFTFNPSLGEVRKGNQIIKLTVKESSLLHLLLSNRGQVLTKALIVERVWGYNSDIEFGNVILYIHYLRKKLKTRRIISIRGVGYCYRNDEVL